MAKYGNPVIYVSDGTEDQKNRLRECLIENARKCGHEDVDVLFDHIAFTESEWTASEVNNLRKNGESICFWKANG